MGIISESEGGKRDNGSEKGSKGFRDRNGSKGDPNQERGNPINNSPSYFEIHILKENLITPYDCPLSLFENEFKRFKNYKIIEKLDEKLVKRIDLNSFTFKILGKIVYGKNFCDQVVIKGEKEVMEIF
ncbi:beta-adaptin [Nosema bombycis CQ1]|uniref:Beta-adaptin n=1 Tax=Nosema bombycis (strain CQ1 / CVCC 102059) TaxID=578461 RepID=R0KME5_NOSB1|nr:beta-adaptin [Nosema bombycis CQ1]|eukprot:EOB11312.1 beta-adaptin [Nosema bombycis CQ1]